MATAARIWPRVRWASLVWCCFGLRLAAINALYAEREWRADRFGVLSLACNHNHDHDHNKASRKLSLSGHHHRHLGGSNQGTTDDATPYSRRHLLVYLLVCLFALRQLL
jgi:hypothetical protein